MPTMIPAMLQQARTYQAMLALPEFTAEDLAKHSGVNLITVRTVISRHGHLVEKVGRRSTGKRGASPIVYRLRDEAQPQLRGALEALEEVRRMAPEPPDDPGELPSGFLAAEDVLLRTLPTEGDADDRESLVASARTLLAGAQEEAARQPHPAAGAHALVVSMLLELSDAEAASDAATWSDIHARLDATRPLLEQVGERPLYDEADARLCASPLADAGHEEGAAETAIGASRKQWVSTVLERLVANLRVPAARPAVVYGVAKQRPAYTAYDRPITVYSRGMRPAAAMDAFGESFEGKRDLPSGMTPASAIFEAAPYLSTPAWEVTNAAWTNKPLHVMSNPSRVVQTGSRKNDTKPLSRAGSVHLQAKG